MAKPTRRRRRLPTPAEQLLEELVRLKAEGWPFEQAWERAWRAISWSDNKDTRREWEDVILSTRSTWAACYLDEGTPLSIRDLIEALSRDTDLDDHLEAA